MHQVIKEGPGDYTIGRHARISPGLSDKRVADKPVADHRASGDIVDAAHVLVDSTRIVGEPLDLYRAPRCGWPLSGRLPDQHDSSAGQDARCAHPDATARIDRTAVSLRGGDDHGDHSHRLRVLLSRRAARRTPRSRHPVLEVDAGFRSHHRALEGEYPARDSPAAHFCDHGSYPVDHAAAEHRGSGGKRPGRSDAMDPCVVCTDVADAALPPFGDSFTLVCAVLWLAFAGLSLGATRAISVGPLAAACDWRGRGDSFQHYAFCQPAGGPFGGRPGS